MPRCGCAYCAGSGIPDATELPRHEGRFVAEGWRFEGRASPPGGTGAVDVGCRADCPVVLRDRQPSAAATFLLGDVVDWAALAVGPDCIRVRRTHVPSSDRP